MRFYFKAISRDDHSIIPFTCYCVFTRDNAKEYTTCYYNTYTFILTISDLRQLLRRDAMVNILNVITLRFVKEERAELYNHVSQYNCLINRKWEIHDTHL